MSRKTREQRLIALQPNHIVCRGNNRRRLFSYPRDYLNYLRLLISAAGQNGCLLHALCLMANHVHLLLTPPTVKAASDAMKAVNQRYAQIRNQQYGGTGKLFETRFESEPIESDRHLMFSVMYINANPYAAGLYNQEQYPWSTQALHSGQPNKYITKNIIQLDPWYLSLGTTEAERAKVYQDCFQAYRGEKSDKSYLEKALRMEPNKSQGLLIRPDGSSAI